MQVKIRNIKTANPFIRGCRLYFNVIHVDLSEDAITISFVKNGKSTLDVLKLETIPEAIIEVIP